MRPPLDPLNQATIDALDASGIPPLEDLSTEEYRELLVQLQAHTPIPGVDVSNFEVKFERRKVRTVVFRPEHLKEEHLPVIFYLHGGSWQAGNVFTHDSLCRDLVLRTGAAIVFPEYTLAPEARFPTQQEEIFSVMQYVARHGNDLCLKTDAFAIAGDSAGGQLSPAVINIAHDRKFEVPITSQVLFMPVVDLREEQITRSERIFAEGFFLTTPSIVKAIELYVPREKDRHSILASPILMNKQEAARQPATLVIVSESDPLRSEGEKFARLLQDAGVQCASMRALGQLHDSVVIESTRRGPTPVAEVILAAEWLKQGLVFSRRAAGRKRAIADEVESSDELDGYEERDVMENGNGNGTRGDKRRRYHY